jgi:hypothetical protein
MTDARARTYDLVVSIVHYNTPELLIRCLAALAEEGSGLRKKIIVVDNASERPPRREAVEAYPDTEIILNPSNRGFGAANNQVFEGWRAKAYLVTNPDVILPPAGLLPLWEHLRTHPDTGVLGCRLLYPDGRAQPSCRRYPTLRAVLLRGLLSEGLAAHFAPIRRYFMAGEVHDDSIRVDWVLGSCLLIRGDVLEKVKGFDEGYFMYYEDIDLCYRVRRAGWHVEYFPAVHWFHDYRRESTSGTSWKLRCHHFYSAMRFLIKYGSERGWINSF